MDKIGFTFASSVFAVILLFLSSLGMPLINSPTSPDQVETGTNICENIGGFNAVGDILGCVAEKLQVFEFIQLTSQNPVITLILTPITVTTSVVVILILRGN